MEVFENIVNQQQQYAKNLNDLIKFKEVKPICYEKLKNVDEYEVGKALKIYPGLSQTLHSKKNKSNTPV